jgi:hypothetical protein
MPVLRKRSLVIAFGVLLMLASASAASARARRGHHSVVQVTNSVSTSTNR